MNRRTAQLGMALVLGIAAWGCTPTSNPSSGSLAALERSLIYYPTPYPQGDWQAADLIHEDAWFASEDGTRLHGWFCPAQNPRAVVLYTHGNAGNVASLKWTARLLQETLRVSVLVFDYRGYGRSEGTPSEEGILADARAARRWLAARTGVAERDLVLLGRSLGGAVAVDLAARDGARGLILENTFTSMPEVAGRKVWPLPVGSVMQTRLDSLSKIGSYHGPLLQTHGDADRVVPFAMGKRLFEAANYPKRFVAVPGGGHNDGPSDEYYRALDEFLARLPPVGDGKREVPVWRPAGG
jgi:fermentation-respiration switch protein FrsA (DUF1100 family)